MIETRRIVVQATSFDVGFAFERIAIKYSLAFRQSVVTAGRAQEFVGVVERLVAVTAAIGGEGSRVLV